MRKSLSRWRRRNTGSREETVQSLIEENITVNQVLQARAEENLTRLHRPIEQIGALVGRPTFIASFLALCLLWMGVNLGLEWEGRRPWDAPPFYWMQGAFGLLSLIVTTTVLVAQARQGQLGEQRAQLALQIALLTEQRSAKTIELLEELRRDLPGVHNRVDPEAEVMMQASDPAAIVEALTTLEAGGETSLPPGGSSSGGSSSGSAAEAREEGRRDGDLLPG